MSGIVAELLIETDVFVDHLRGAHALRLGHDSVSYSVITRCELFAGTTGKGDAIDPDLFVNGPRTNAPSLESAYKFRVIQTKKFGQ